MRIAIVSVAPPYRGGISLNTAILITHLQQRHTVSCFNFSRQYPGFLFPGKTQYETGPPAVAVESNRTIDSMNPLSWLSTARQIAAFQADVVIIRYWHPFFAPAMAMIASRVKKYLPGVQLLAISDNIRPHESHFIDSTLTKYFLKKMDKHIVLSESVEKDLLSLVPNAVFHRLFHPVFNVFGEIQDQQTARQKLGIHARHMILYFGYVRRYKGLDTLIQAAAELRKTFSDFQVLAVGECYEDQEKYHSMIVRSGIEDVFTWHNEYVPDETVGSYFSAADVVALPYHDATQSGVVPLAYHFNKPVVVTRVGGLHEVVNEGKSGFLVPPDDPAALANCLRKNLLSGNFSRMSHDVETFKQQFSWEQFTNDIEEFLSE